MVLSGGNKIPRTPTTTAQKSARLAQSSNPLRESLASPTNPFAARQMLARSPFGVPECPSPHLSPRPSPSLHAAGSGSHVQHVQPITVAEYLERVSLTIDSGFGSDSGFGTCAA